jgi:type II secretion system (T2SS) protein E
MAAAKKLGEMLIEAGLIDDFQLSSALSHQRNWGGKLGKVLMELEFVREEDIARVMGEKLKIPYINLFEPEIDESIIKLIKADLAKKYNVVPARREKGMLMLAMSDPLDIEAIDEIRFITGLNIKPTIAMESEIQDAIKKYYDGVEVVRKKTLSPFYQREHSSGGKMEIIHGSDLNMPKAEQADEKSPVLSREETAQQALQDCKFRIDALMTLLIEKGIISRDELISMIYHKKMGL